MIVTCPACATRYLVNPSALGPGGRTVRCAKCHETWHQDPPVESARTASEAVTPPALVGGGMPAQPDEGIPDFIRPPRAGGTRLPALAKPKPRLTRVQLGGMALAGAVVLLIAVLAVFRQPIVAAWPAAGRLYLLVGVQSGPHAGLAVRGLSSSRTTVEGQPALLVAGEVTNASGGAMPVPKLRLSLTDANRQVLRSVDFSVAPTQLLPGESAPFQAMVDHPPSDATSATVTFLDD
jgi:predicted Zn finger-like uncharacterized protein